MTNTTALAGASAPAAGPTVLGWFEPGTDEWHAARANGIGGSEIAAVLGLSPYESRFSLWHRKKGLIGPVEETEEMYWGKEHEPAICRRFAREHPDLDVTPAPTYATPTGRGRSPTPTGTPGPTSSKRRPRGTPSGGASRALLGSPSTTGLSASTTWT